MCLPVCSIFASFVRLLQGDVGTHSDVAVWTLSLLHHCWLQVDAKGNLLDSTEYSANLSTSYQCIISSLQSHYDKKKYYLHQLETRRINQVAQESPGMNNLLGWDAIPGVSDASEEGAHQGTMSHTKLVVYNNCINKCMFLINAS